MGLNCFEIGGMKIDVSVINEVIMVGFGWIGWILGEGKKRWGNGFELLVVGGKWERWVGGRKGREGGCLCIY